MESDREHITLDEALKSAIQGGHNCILIGESHLNSTSGLLAVANFLYKNKDLCQRYKISIFVEGYPALAEDQLKPLQKNDLDIIESNEQLRALVKVLMNDVSIYGLETQETDPFLIFKKSSRNYVPESVSALLKIALENDLLDSLLERTDSTIDHISKEFDFNTLYSLLVNLYGRTQARLLGPNDKFCSIINRVSPETICIAIVGNAHIPKVKRKNSNNTLDVGMLSRLNEQDRTRKLFVTAITDNCSHFEEPYWVEENSYEYEPIENIRLVESTYAIFEHFEHYPFASEPEPLMPLPEKDNSFGPVGGQSKGALIIAHGAINEERFEDHESNSEEDSKCCYSFFRNC